MIDDEAYYPGCRELEKENTQCGFPAFQFPVDRGDGGSTGNIQKAEGHQCISVCSAKSHASQQSYHVFHAVCGGDIVDPEQDAAA